MRKRFLISAFLVLTCGGFGAGSFWRGLTETDTQKKAAEAALSMAQLKESPEASVSALTKERDEARLAQESLRNEVTALRKKVAEFEAKAADAALAQAKVRSRPPSAQQAGTGPMKSMAEIMTDPGMKEAVINQNLAQMDMLYGKLFDRLQLDDTDKQAFKSLLSDRMRAELEMGLGLMGKDSSPTDQKAAVEALSKAKADNDQKIRTFLNNEADYKTFQTWEQTKSDRMMLNMGAASFSGAGEPLTAAQEDRLVAAMFDARLKNISNVPDLTKPENLTATNLSPQMSQNILASYDAQAAQVAAGAAAYLSPVQLEALKTFQKQQRAMQEMGLKMGAAMFGGK